MEQSRIAKVKIKTLEARHDFTSAQETQSGVVLIEFTGGKHCTVNHFGRVEWSDCSHE